MGMILRAIAKTPTGRIDGIVLIESTTSDKQYAGTRLKDLNDILGSSVDKTDLGHSVVMIGTKAETFYGKNYKYK